MCQSKAEGGRRCAFHLEQGVNTGMASFAGSVTGLSSKEVKEAYESLEREGQNVPDPSREDVDAFLEQQVFRARHEASLTEKRRESIMARLQAAIGRITPSGATFHAWKNLVAESWSRVRRKAAAAFVAGALSFSLGACGNAPEPPADTARAENVAAAPATPSPSVEYDTTYNAVRPTISPEASAKYGPKGAVQGTSAAVDFTMDHGFDHDMIAATPGQHEDAVLAMSKDMTPATAAQWEAAVKKFNSGKAGREKEAGRILSLTLYSPWPTGTTDTASGDPLTVQTDGPTAVNPTLKKVHTSLENDGRLKVDVESSADIRLVVGSDPVRMKIDRTSTFWMVKTGDGWKIDGWNGLLKAGQYKSDN